jgi:hypothetical protein
MRRRQGRFGIIVPVTVTLIYLLTVSCSNTNHQNKISENCFEIFDGEKYFIGSTDCMDGLPLAYFDGYFVSNLVYTVFYNSYNSLIIGYDNKSYWLNMSPYAEEQIRKYDLGGRYRIFKIKFEGSASDRKGFYGNGTFSKSVHVKKFTYIGELQ